MSESLGFGPLNLQALLGVTLAQANAPLPQTGYWQNFRQSAYRSGSSELVGLPGQWTGDVDANNQWRNENFWASMGSQVLGAIPAYAASAVAAPAIAGTSAVARLAPSLARLFSQEAVLARPVATTVGRALTEVAPISITRAALTPALGGDLEATAASIGLDALGAGALGAAFGAVRAVRSGSYANEVERMLVDRVPEYSINAPPQERLTALQQALPNFQSNPDMTRIIQANIEGRSLDVRLERVRGGQNFLGDLEGLDTKLVRENLNRLFSLGEKKGYDVHTLSNSATGFPTQQAWRDVVAEVGLPDGWETNVQFPRVVRASTPDQATRIGTNIERLLTDVGDGWALRRQTQDDMFVIARRLQADAEGRQRWFVARTNDPNKFIKQAPMFKRNDRLSKFVGQVEEDGLKRAATAMTDDAAGIPVLKQNQMLLEAMPANSRRERAKWDLAEHVDSAFGNPSKEYAPAAGALWQKVKNAAAPAMAQFTKQPLASWAYSQARATFEMAQGRGRRWLYGDVKVDGAPASVLFRGTTDSGGLRGKFNSLKQGDVQALQRFWAARLSGTERGEAMRTALDALTPDEKMRVEGFLNELFKVQDGVFNEVLATEKAVGKRLTVSNDAYEFPHVWAGEWRQRVLAENGQLRFMGAGNTREEAYQAAKRYAEANGLRVDQRGPFMADREADLQEALQLLRAQRTRGEKFKPTEPGNLERRQRIPIGGYVGDPGLTPPKLEELWKVLENDIQTKMQNVASLVVERRYANPGMKAELLARYGTDVSNALTKRLNDMAGRQTELSRWQNKALSTLDPVLGKNSATKIATTWNAVETHLNLFAGNMGYVAANAVAFFQSVAPKLALTRQLLARGETSRAFALYDFAPMLTAEGAKGAAAHMNPWKLAMGAMRDMQRLQPGAREHFARAIREGAVAPKMFDEYLGENARVWTSLKRMAEGEEPVVNGIRAAAGVNSFIPVKVEEFTRAHTFFVGLRMSEAMGLQGEAAYQLAKQFTLRTMYGYSQADRPRLFTGPAGMVAGLFKNWMFHYLADFGMYSREAMRGNYAGLLWATAGTAAIGGLGGIPLYAVIDSFQKRVTNKPLMEELYGAVGEQAGDALYYGLPGLLGVSLQASASAPFNDPVRDITFMFNIAALDRVARIAKMGGEAYNQWARGGNNPLESDRTWDLIAYSMMPRTVYKSMAQVEEGALRSIRNGRPILDGITGMEEGLNTVGLTPTRIARAWEASESLWGDQQTRRQRTSGYSDAFFEAWIRGDSRSMTDSMARAIEQGVDVSAMMQGAMQRMRNNALPQMPFDYLRMPEGRGVDRLRTLGLMGE